MGNIWDGIFDGVDWDAVDREVEKSAAEKAREYFASDGFDYKRSYLRALFRKHPEITDVGKIDTATEAMYESHTEGVELDVDDALRVVANETTLTDEQLVQMLLDSGITDESFMDTLSKGVHSMKMVPSTIKNKDAVRKARIMESLADVLGKNKDVIVLGLPMFDPLGTWTQVKLAVFSENMSMEEKGALQTLIRYSDKHTMNVKNGIAILSFKIYNIWDD